ncbi:DUF1236 domain-containing protein [Roseicyclus sp. F158]|uniref:DUF1236 domain-containing protein n=1 Tax=Tropicimonas omnivorans TaxID=3075590 RepID=A0ABU3DJ59_9RHOB|nr:DUF1236 domain-containing protein [Roseicyclus sp. F158]MDT0683753.1 DUF1236 domain-containing protein [Roseicyclus sp. F158]
MSLRKTLALTTAAVLAAGAVSAQAVDATATTDLNFRAGPGPDYEVLGVIGANDTVAINGCVEAANWCEVSYDGTTGWAYGEYLNVPVGSETVAISTQPETVTVETIEYQDTRAQSATAGATVGATIGALAGGPIGAVAGGAITGAALGAAADPGPQVLTYVSDNPVDPVLLDGEVVVGAGIPDVVDLYDVPESDFQYVYVNGQPVIVDGERRIVRIIR